MSDNHQQNPTPELDSSVKDTVKNNADNNNDAQNQAAEINDAENQQAENNDQNLADMPLTEHLVELRSRLIKIMVSIIIPLVPMLFFINDIFYMFSQPLVEALPMESNIVATDLVDGFMAQVRLCVMLAILVAIPYILYQIWSFVAPGLYRHEKKIALPVLLSSIILFYTGVAFAYFIILQRALVFLVTILPINVVSMPEMDSYLNFASKIMMVFGVTFQIPIFVFILVVTGMVSASTMADKRRYIIVACFAASGFLSPPDVPSMFLLALPMILLFEFGLLMARLLVKEKKRDLTNSSAAKVQE